MNRYTGFPIGCTSDANGGHLDQDNYTVRTWLGLLGPNASTTIIDSSLYGDITIELTLAASDVLMLSPAVGTLTSYWTATKNEIGIATTAGTLPLLLHHKVLGIHYLILVSKLYVMICPNHNIKL
jgi:hypothetical protein